MAEESGTVRRGNDRRSIDSVHRALDHGRRVAQVPGWCPKDQAFGLAQLASKVPSNQAVVEVGSFMGLSLCWLYYGTLEGNLSQVYSVDLNDPEYKKAKGITEGLHRVDVVDSIHYCNDILFLDGASVDVAATYNGPDIGLLYIDALHEYNAVRNDFFAWSRHCDSKCTVVFDDFNRDNPDVMAAVMDLMSHGHLKFKGLFSQGIITCLT